MKTTNKKRMMLTAALATAFAMPAAALRADNEFGSNTPYYEDDAWYDVSEWFDGNDYNPTDEAIGRWDDEKFDFADNATSSDQDNDWSTYGDYGYRNGNESDWFYDYYDDGHQSWSETYYSNYYDTNDDGLYDAYATYHDSDGDGIYEDFQYFALDLSSDSGQQADAEREAKNQQKQMRSTPGKIAGKVEKTKTVKVRDRSHLVAWVSQSDGKSFLVDLGPDHDEGALSEGDNVSATGHAIKVGDKPILVAKKASLNSGSVTIDRSGKKYQGTIEKTKTVKVRGTEHQLAKVNTENGKTMMVDLGPATNLDKNLKEGSQVTVQGVPVKLKDRVVLMARQVTVDGNKIEIKRREAQSAS